MDSLCSNLCNCLISKFTTSEIKKKPPFLIPKPPSGDYEVLIPSTAGVEGFSAAAAIDWMEMSGVVQKVKPRGTLRTNTCFKTNFASKN